jgi:hypothetical protein
MTGTTPGATPREALVLLDVGAGSAARAAVARHGRVLQQAGERLLVVEAAGGSLDALADALRSVPGVTRVVVDPAHAATIGGLDAGEALFAEAWASRRTSPPKGARRGEGVDWDAPGFQAP